jgi:hypothetical protein
MTIFFDRVARVAAAEADLSELERIALKHMLAIVKDGGTLDWEAQVRFEAIESRLTADGRI